MPDETVPLLGEAPSLGELIEDSDSGKIYEVVAIDGANLTKRLVFWNDEHVTGEKAYINISGLKTKTIRF